MRGRKSGRWSEDVVTPWEDSEGGREGVALGGGVEACTVALFPYLARSCLLTIVSHVAASKGTNPHLINEALAETQRR